MFSKVINFVIESVFILLLFLGPVVYIFLLVFTVGLRDRDTKLKIRENGVNILKKLLP